METEKSDAAPQPAVGNGEPASSATNGGTSPTGSIPAGGSGIQPPKVRALPKPSGIKPPSANLSGSTTSLASTSSQLTTASQAATASSATRIGRLCMGHTPPKAGLPPPEPKRNETLRDAGGKPIVDIHTTATPTFRRVRWKEGFPV
ncbi:hypothetical protein ZHAS_00020768 [Anopheles sinensis]|uniref:Uncharacterized protein n=1 Tax=Anopheles sinensis TaxID=74873 RepID=A0A084WQM6_ANOSI|nr:hypothetical protein ZHAS_00020768 [Anopheles sinensis]